MAFRNWKQELDDVRPPPPSPWPLVWRTGAALAFVGAATCMALWVWPGYLKPRPWLRPGPAPASLRILLSSDLRGYLEPCGCTEQRWGGIARQRSVVARGMAKAGPGGAAVPACIALDAGDMTAGRLLWQKVGLEHYLTALGKMNYTAANLGAREVSMSAAWISELATRSPVPLVSANVCAEAGGGALAGVAPYRQVMVSNLRVTIVGVVTPDPQWPPGAGVRVLDVDEALAKLLPALRSDTDVIVLLAACDEPTIKKIARSHPELDMVLGGWVLQASKEVLMQGACRVVALADKGQMMAQVDVGIRPDGQPAKATSKMIVLDNDVPEDAQMLDLVKQHNAELARLNRAGGMEALGVPTLPPPAGENRYTGSDQCRNCHAHEYEVWSASRHAKAYASLVRRQRDSNPDCISCHVVDLGAGDGFRGVNLSPGSVNVQCESCHGRAGEHVRTRIAGDMTVNMPRVLPRTCDGCHDCKHSPEFSYGRYWEKIKHGAGAEK